MTLSELQSDPNYVNANAATKRAIFDKFSANDPNYASANEATRAAIRQKFGVEAVAPKSAQTPAKPMSEVNTELTIPEKIASRVGDIKVGDVLQNLPLVGPAVRAASEVTGLGQKKAFDLGARAVVGAADPNIAATQIIANAVGAGDKVNKRVSEMNANIAATRGDEADDIDWLRMAGNLSNPAVIKAFSAIPGGLSLLKRVIAGAGAGGAGGALTPVDVKDKAGGEDKSFVSEKLKQVEQGAVFGGALPLVSAALTPAAKTVYRATLEPVIDKAAVKGRAYVDAAGERVDDVINALKENKQIVPGSMPTAGEAAAKAGSAEFSALQAAASKFRPSEYQARVDEQNAARIAQVRTVGQDEAALKAAEAARDMAKKGNYAAAFRTVVKADPELARMASNPYFRDALPAANKMAKASELDPKTNLTEYLDLVVKGMQDKLTKTGEGSLGGNEKRLLTEAKNDLVEWIGKKNPDYLKARQQFAAASRPINQMQIGQELEKKLVPALSEEAPQRANVFANAVQDAPSLIKKATGQPRFQSLTEALEPAQMAAIQSVQDDLARGARFDLLARKGKGSVSLVDIPEKLETPTIFNQVATITRAIIERAQGKVNKQLAAEIAAEMLNPVTVADSMQKSVLKTAQNKQLAERVAKSTNAAVFAAQE